MKDIDSRITIKSVALIVAMHLVLLPIIYVTLTSVNDNILGWSDSIMLPVIGVACGLASALLIALTYNYLLPSLKKIRAERKRRSLE